MHKTSGSGDRKKRSISFLTASAEVILVTLARPPRRGRIARRDLGRAQRHQMAALVGIAAHLRAIFAAHVPLQFVDWRRFRPTHDIKRDRLVSIATEAPDREIAV